MEIKHEGRKYGMERMELKSKIARLETTIVRVLEDFEKYNYYVILLNLTMFIKILLNRIDYYTKNSYNYLIKYKSEKKYTISKIRN